MIILGVLRLGQGMESLELIPEEQAVKFFGSTDLNYVYKKDGLIESFEDVPLGIISKNGSIHMNLVSKNGRSVDKFLVKKNETRLKNFEALLLKDKNGKELFTTRNPTFNLLQEAGGLHTKMVQTNRVVSNLEDKLDLEGKTINLKGAEGTTMEGREIVWSADQDIYLKSINGSLVLSGKEGIFLDLQKIPVVNPKHGEYVSAAQYKICVCMPQGKLFRLPVPNNPNARVYCNHISAQSNPCM